MFSALTIPLLVKSVPDLLVQDFETRFAGQKREKKPMHPSLRIRLLVAGFLTGFALATISSATGASSPIGLWKNEDATFEIFENDGKLGARVVALACRHFRRFRTWHPRFSKDRLEKRG